MKEYKEIGSFKSMEMTFTIEDADLDKLHEVLKDINVMECPWFEVQDKHGNKAKYYREPHWIPCSEDMPKKPCECLATIEVQTWEITHRIVRKTKFASGRFKGADKVLAWMPLPEPWKGEEE